MGPELGSLYHELEEEVDWLQQKWNEFRELFAKGAERIELLNTVAPNFFYMLHKLMFEDAMLHLCRLTDSSQTKVRVGKRVFGAKSLLYYLESAVRVETAARRNPHIMAAILNGRE
jgi:hypothetical protein